MRLRSTIRIYWPDALTLDADSDIYNGLLLFTQIMLDAIVGGSLNNKTPKQSVELFEVMVSNNYQRHN